MNDLQSSVQRPFPRRPPCLKEGELQEPRLQECLRRDWADRSVEGGSIIWLTGKW